MPEWLIERLSDRLHGPLPGPAAQYRMAHVGRRHAPTPPPEARLAGVLALLYPKGHEWHLVLIERITNQKDRHSGQISFPGGRHEEQDHTLEHTALREAEEEIGVAADSIEVLGSLTELYIPVSNYRVQPYVGFVDYAPRFSPQASEVAAILEVPFRVFSLTETIRHTNLQVAENLVLQRVPHYFVGGKIVWGATAMMLSELVALTQENLA